MTAVEAAALIEDEAAKSARFRQMGAMGRKKAEENRKERIREQLQSQDLRAWCELCGESWHGNALDVIAAQARHRQEVHGLQPNRKKRPTARQRQATERTELRERLPGLIIEYLREHGESKKVGIVAAMKLHGIAETAVAITMTSLRKEGKIESSCSGVWSLPDG